MASSGQDRPRDAGGGRSSAGLWSLFLVALALRLLAAVALDTPGDAEGLTPWQWGGEAPTLAAALADGRGLSDPWIRGDGAWAVGTGPSSWLTPVYPWIVSVAMKAGASGATAAGVAAVTATTAWLVFALQALASAATAVLVVLLGRRLGQARAGRLAGWLFALYPIAIWNAVGVVWDTTLVAFGICAALLALLSFGRSLRGLAASGLVFGCLLFLNPAPVAMLPGILGWILLGAFGKNAELRGRWPAAIGGAALFTGVAISVCVPWMLRNQRVLGTYQLRPNFGVELRLGNHDEATGRPLPFKHHPSHVEAERALYVELGEAAYGQENAGRAMDWIRSNPGPFLGLTLKRGSLFWWGELPTNDRRASGELRASKDPASWVKFLVYSLSGAGALLALCWLAIDRGLTREHVFLLAGALLCFGGPYYLTHVSERYRFPIDPLLILLDAWLLLRLLGRTGEESTQEPGPALDGAGPAVS